MSFLIPEAIVYVTLCASSRVRRFEFAQPNVVFNNSGAEFFQIQTGVSLEKKLRNEIEDIIGVSSASIKRSGDSLEVDVTMATYAFESFEKVIQKELELSRTHPSLNCRFNVTFSEDAAYADSAVYARSPEASA